MKTLPLYWLLVGVQEALVRRRITGADFNMEANFGGGFDTEVDIPPNGGGFQ
jgi:hypothetical protein